MTLAIQSNKSQWLWAILELTGVAALVLPFTWWDTSPLGAIIDPISYLSFRSDFRLIMVGVPFGLAIIISLLGFLDLTGKKLSSRMAWMSTIFGLIAGPGITIASVVLLFYETQHNRDSAWGFVYIFVSLLCLISFGLALIGKYKKYPAADVTHATLRVGYLPNAVLCLLGFSDMFTHLAELTLGAAFTAVTAMLYLIHGGFIIARATRNQL